METPTELWYSLYMLKRYCIPTQDRGGQVNLESRVTKGHISDELTPELIPALESFTSLHFETEAKLTQCGFFTPGLTPEPI